MAAAMFVLDGFPTLPPWKIKKNVRKSVRGKCCDWFPHLGPSPLRLQATAHLLRMSCKWLFMT